MDVPVPIPAKALRLLLHPLPLQCRLQKRGHPRLANFLPPKNLWPFDGPGTANGAPLLDVAPSIEEGLLPQSAHGLALIIAAPSAFSWPNRFFSRPLRFFLSQLFILSPANRPGQRRLVFTTKPTQCFCVSVLPCCPVCPLIWVPPAARPSEKPRVAWPQTLHRPKEGQRGTHTRRQNWLEWPPIEWWGGKRAAAHHKSGPAFRLCCTWP